MTDYTDVPTASALHAESQQIVSAIANIDAGGTVVNMTIAPPPYTAPEPGVPMPPMMMAVSVVVPPPVDPALTAQLRTWMDQRLVDISAEMTALGVTVPPVTTMASAQRVGIPPLPQQPPMSVMPPAPPPPTIPPPPAMPRTPEPPKE